MTPTHSSAALLTAFDRLFERAAAKLDLECTADQREQARRLFAERYADALRIVDQIEMPAIAEPTLASMESAIDELPAASIAAHLATVPLAIHVRESVRQIVRRAAEQRALEHLINQADETYGGS